MAKFGKSFRKHRVQQWIENYIDYKSLKHFIKEQQNISKGLNNSIISPLSKEDLQKTFISNLDSELKKIYIFFVQTERELYVQINSHLHIRSTFINFSSRQINNELNELNLIAFVALNLINYINSNMIAMSKILKKFEKKFGIKDFASMYVKNKLESKNSDILYIFQFKIIDEVTALLEELKNELRGLFIKINSEGVSRSNSISLSNDNGNGNDIDNGQQLMAEGEVAINQDDNEPLSNSDIDRNFRMLEMNLEHVENIFDTLKKMEKDWYSKFKYAKGTEESSPIFEGDESNALRANLGGISKENTWNLIATFLHVWFMGMSVTLVIPIIFQSIEYISINTTNSLYYSGVIIALAPLCSLLSLFYTTEWVEVTYKNPMIFSCLLAILGHTVYCLSFTFKSMILMGIGRILIGFGLNFRITKMYIINNIPKLKVSRYLLIYKFLMMTGFASGPLLNMWYATNYVISETLAISRYSFSSWLCILFSLILIIMIMIFYVEPVDQEFNAYGETTRKRSNSFMLEETITEREGSSFQALNDRLDQFNEQNQYNDTNLVAKSIDLMVLNDRRHLSSLKQIFWLICLLFLINKFANMYIMAITPFILARGFTLNLNFDQRVLLLYFCPLTFNILIYFVNFFFFTKKISPRYCLILVQVMIICFMSVVLIGGDMVIYTPVEEDEDNSPPSMLYPSIMFSGCVVFCSLLDDTILRLLSKIIPYNYKMLKLKAGDIVELVSNFGQVLGAVGFLFIYLDIHDDIDEDYKNMRFTYVSMVFIGIIIIYAVLMLLELIFFRFLKERPLTRILLLKSKRRIKRTEY